MLYVYKMKIKKKFCRIDDGKVYSSFYFFTHFSCCLGQSRFYKTRGFQAFRLVIVIGVYKLINSKHLEILYCFTHTRTHTYTHKYTSCDTGIEYVVCVHVTMSFDFVYNFLFLQINLMLKNIKEFRLSDFNWIQLDYSSSEWIIWGSWSECHPRSSFLWKYNDKPRFPSRK